MTRGLREGGINAFVGMNEDGADTSSNESFKLSPSPSRSCQSLSLSDGFSLSIGKLCTKLVREPGEVPPSDESESEWKEDMDEAGAWPPRLPTSSSERLEENAWSASGGFSICEPFDKAPNLIDGGPMLMGDDADRRDWREGFRGGSGGTFTRDLGGEDSKLINGVLSRS